MTKNGNENLSGAYSLNALTPHEREAYERAIANSEESRSEATELQDTAVLLGLSVQPVAPSEGLRERLLAQVAVTPQLPEQVADVTPGPAERRAQSRWSRPIVAITSVAAALALIVGGIAVGTTSLHPEPSFQDAQMAAINAAPDRQQVAMTLESGEGVTLRWSPELASSALIVEGMDPAPSNKVYQLWYMGESGARPAGILSIDGEKSWHVLEGTMSAGDTVGVTLEPMGGSEEPTSDPIMVIEPS